MNKIISVLVWIDTKIHKNPHKQWTGIDGYWIAYGKIGDAECQKEDQHHQ